MFINFRLLALWQFIHSFVMKTSCLLFFHTQMVFTPFFIVQGSVFAFGKLFCCCLLCFALHLRFFLKLSQNSHITWCDQLKLQAKARKKNIHTRTHMHIKNKKSRHVLDIFVIACPGLCCCLFYHLTDIFGVPSPQKKKKNLLCCPLLEQLFLVGWRTYLHTRTQIRARFLNCTHWHRCELPSKQKEVKARSALCAIALADQRTAFVFWRWRRTSKFHINIILVLFICVQQ